MGVWVRRALIGAAATAGVVLAVYLGATAMLVAVGPFGDRMGNHADPAAPLWDFVRERLPADQRDRWPTDPRQLTPEQRGELAQITKPWLADRGLLDAVNAFYGADGAGLPQSLASALDVGDARLLQWLVWHLDGRDLFDPQGPPLTAADQDALASANRIVLAPILNGPRAPEPAALPPTLQAEDRAWTVDQKLRALDNPVRDGQLPPDRILRELGVRPGLIVVDIGAGEGLLSLPMARAVTPDGLVVAADIDPRMVDLLQQRARAQGLDRLKPVEVRPGLDPLYTRMGFDVAVLCTVYEYLDAPVAFLRHLRPALRKGSGRLAILQGKVGTPFFASDFGLGFRHDRLRKLGDRAPPDLQAAVDRIGRGDVAGDALRQRLAAFFNDLARDPDLPRTWKPAAGAGDDAKLLAWLAAYRNVLQPAEIQAAALRTEVQIVLREFFANGLNREVFPRGIYLGEHGLVRALGRAGYRLERRVEGFAAHDFWIFAPVE